MDKKNNQPLVSLKGVPRSIKKPLLNIGQNPSQYQACATDKSKTNGEKNFHLKNYPKEITMAYRELPEYRPDNIPSTYPKEITMAYRELPEYRPDNIPSTCQQRVVHEQVSKNEQDKGNSGEKRLTLTDIAGKRVVKSPLILLNRANIHFTLENQKKKSNPTLGK